MHDLDDYRFLMYDSVIAKGERWHEIKAPPFPKFRLEYKKKKTQPKEGNSDKCGCKKQPEKSGKASSKRS